MVGPTPSTQPGSSSLFSGPSVKTFSVWVWAIWLPRNTAHMVESVLSSPLLIKPRVLILRGAGDGVHCAFVYWLGPSEGSCSGSGGRVGMRAGRASSLGWGGGGRRKFGDSGGGGGGGSGPGQMPREAPPGHPSCRWPPLGGPRLSVHTPLPVTSWTESTPPREAQRPDARPPSELPPPLPR